MSIIQQIKCKLGYHFKKSYEYVGFDDITGNLTLRCIKCKGQILIKPMKETEE